MVGIADLADRGVAAFVDAADFAGGQLDESVTGFTVAQDNLLASATADLAATAWSELHIVNGGTERDDTEREGIAHFRSGLGAGGLRLRDDRLAQGDDRVVLVRVQDCRCPVGCGRGSRTGRVGMVVGEGCQCIGRKRKITSTINPGMAARQVMLKKLAQPTTGTR